MAPHVRNLLKGALRVGLSALALLVVFRQVNTQQLTRVLQAVQPAWFLAALLLYSFSKLISSFRLTRYFRANSIEIAESENLRLYWIGMFYNLFLPGGIGGDAYKVWVLHRDWNAPASKAFQSVLFDRLSGLFILASLAFLTAWAAFPDVMWAWTMLPAALLSIAGLVIVHWLFAKVLVPVISSTTMYSFVVQLIQMLCAWTLLQALGLPDHTGAYLAVFLVSSAVSVLPISIGGIGIRELVFITAAQYTPVSQETAVAFSLLFFVVTALCSLPGAFVRLPSKKVR